MLTYTILTPERTVAEGTALQITLPTPKGDMTLRPRHIDLVTLLSPGEMVVVEEGGASVHLAVSTGVARVTAHGVTILADTAERSEELALEAIERAKQAADAMLQEARNKDDVAYAHAAAMLERELARYRVAKKRRSV